MPENLFFLGHDNAPRVMSPSGFLSENEFQSLLERYPELLTDSDFGEGSSRRWVLVRREAGIAREGGGGDHWSLDHLFLDQAGVPTLVEVKRASDTRARREVVAQMLDYAANAVSWWRADEVKTWFDSSSSQVGLSSADRLALLLDTETPDVEEYWRQVEANLGSGRIRMLFVADRISPELQRIVEFLNEQMRPATVAALELKLYSDDHGKILAPRLIGATQRALLNKSVAKEPPAESVEQWLADIETDQRVRIQRFLSISDSLSASHTVAGQSIAVEFTCLRADGRSLPVRCFYLRKNGKFSISIYMLSQSASYQTEIQRLALVDKLKHLEFDVLERSKSPLLSDVSFPLPQPTDHSGWKRIEELVNMVRDDLLASNIGTQP